MSSSPRRSVEEGRVEEQRAECEEKKGAGPGAPPDQSRGRCWRSKSKAWWALVWQLGWFVFLRSAIAAQAQTRATRTTPTVTLRVYNYARVSDNVLRSAKEQAAKAFLQAGIETD